MPPRETSRTRSFVSDICRRAERSPEGCFIGFGSAITLQANLTALAARRCITPTHKLKLILSEQIASFLLGYADVIVLLQYLRNILNLDFQGQFGKMLIISLFGSLIGVSMGLFIGSLSRLNEGIKIGIMLAISMSCCFLSGLMNGSMKDTVEKHAPIINRFNPAALISDALYCINVYDDASRYYRNLITLIVMSAALVLASFLLIRDLNDIRCISVKKFLLHNGWFTGDFRYIVDSTEVSDHTNRHECRARSCFILAYPEGTL